MLACGYLIVTDRGLRLPLLWAALRPSVASWSPSTTTRDTSWKLAFHYRWQSGLFFKAFGLPRGSGGDSEGGRTAGCGSLRPVARF